MINFLLEHYWITAIWGFIMLVMIFLGISYVDRRTWYGGDDRDETRNIDDSI